MRAPRRSCSPNELGIVSSTVPSARRHAGRPASARASGHSSPSPALARDWAADDFVVPPVPPAPPGAARAAGTASAPGAARAARGPSACGPPVASVAALAALSTLAAVTTGAGRVGVVKRRMEHQLE